jgi:RNA polymerase sigma-70 factor, ECF subfamily
MVRAPRDTAVDYPPVGRAGGEADPEDERALVEAARTDPAAFAQLYRHYLPKIHAFAFRRTHSQHLAEDITAATFERAYRQLDRFEWRGGGFGAWIYRIATNELVDHYRRHHRSQSDRGQAALGALHAGSTHDDLDHIDDGGEEGRRLLAALSTINPRYQEAINLRYLSGLSHEEAADAMGSTKPVMAVTLSRALKALRKAMDDAPGEEA